MRHIWVRCASGNRGRCRAARQRRDDTPLLLFPDQAKPGSVGRVWDRGSSVGRGWFCVLSGGIARHGPGPSWRNHRLGTGCHDYRRYGYVTEYLTWVTCTSLPAPSLFLHAPFFGPNGFRRCKSTGQNYLMGWQTAACSERPFVSLVFWLVGTLANASRTARKTAGEIAPLLDTSKRSPWDAVLTLADWLNKTPVITRACDQGSAGRTKCLSSTGSAGAEPSSLERAEETKRTS